LAEPIISVSGLRGIIGKELTPEVAIRFARAFCSQLAPGPILLSRDGRTSGPLLCDAIASGIVACGRECRYLDVTATPTLGVAVQNLKAAGAIQVSASHNPPPYNGMKLFGPDGRVLPASLGHRVLVMYRKLSQDSHSAPWAAFDSIGSRSRVEDPHQAHLDRVLATVDVQAIRQQRIRVLVDSNHGAGSILAARLLEALGCDFQIIGGSMRALMLHRGPLVTNCASSSMTEYLANKYQVPFFRSKVGEANVVDCMLEHKALYGGEGSGGPIDPRVVLVRDSFVGMAQVLDLMVATGKSISQLVDSLPRFAMIKDKMTLSKEKLDASIELLQTGLQADSVSTLDGVRLDWADGWLLLRSSNTEPLVRLIAEAPDKQSAEDLIRRAKSLMENV